MSDSYVDYYNRKRSGFGLPTKLLMLLLLLLLPDRRP
jgi:hypothetical protein